LQVKEYKIKAMNRNEIGGLPNRNLINKECLNTKIKILRLNSKSETAQ